MLRRTFSSAALTLEGRVFVGDEIKVKYEGKNYNITIQYRYISLPIKMSNRCLILHQNVSAGARGDQKSISGRQDRYWDPPKSLFIYYYELLDPDAL
jgi:hypothetical protein